MVTLKTPNVYIEELPAQGPIAGVGTSTAAFIGPARKGAVNVATKITNWSQFKDTFGDFITQPRRYLAYAVRGFFENGGTVGYVVRVSNGVRAWRELDDRAPVGPAGRSIRVEAKEEGAAGNNIQVTVSDAQILAAGAARIRRALAPLAQAQANVLRLQNAADVRSSAKGTQSSWRRRRPVMSSIEFAVASWCWKRREPRAPSPQIRRCGSPT